MMDYIILEQVKNKNFMTQNFKPYSLFLNGEYWGLYYLGEQYDKNYIGFKYKIQNKKNIIFIKNYKIEEGVNEDINLFNEIISYIENNDMTIKNNFEKAKQLIDINSFIDYYAVQIYINNIDILSNIALWRTRNKENNKYGDMKWRYMLFDVGGQYLVTRKEKALFYLKMFLNETFVKKLLENKEIKHKFAHNIIKLSFNEFNPKEMSKTIKEQESKFYYQIQKDFERYHGKTYENQFQDSYEYKNSFKTIESFFNARPSIIHTMFCKELDYDQPTEEEVKNVCQKYR